MLKNNPIEWRPASFAATARHTNSIQPTNTTPTHEHKRFSPKIAFVLIAVMFAFAPWAYHCAARTDIDADPFTYAQHAKEILAGYRLYSDIYFDKGPLGLLGFAIPELLSPRNYLAIGTFLGFLLIAQCFILIWNFRHNPVAAIAVSFFILLFPLTSYSLDWLSTEHLSNLFVAANLAIAYSISRSHRFSIFQCFLVGVFSCLALNTRQTSLMSALVPAVAMATSSGSIRRALLGFGSAMLGGILSTIAILFVVSRLGEVKGYLDALFLHSATYASLGTMHSAWELISRNSTSPLAILVIAFATLGLFSGYSRLTVSAIFACLLTIILPKRDANHYLVGIFPYVALLIGIALDVRPIPGSLWKKSRKAMRRNFEPDSRRRAVGLALRNEAVLTEIRASFDNKEAGSKVQAAAARLLPQAAKRAFGWAAALFMVVSACGPIFLTLKDATQNPNELQMAEVAKLTDRIAPPSATLFVWGRLGSEPIVFASKLPRANKFWILWMMDKESAPLLPISVDQIRSQYLANPPTVMVMDQVYLDHSRRGIPTQTFRAGWELGNELLMKYRYVIKASLNGFDIAVLENGPGGIPTALKPSN
jgi:hypothetical protein